MDKNKYVETWENVSTKYAHCEMDGEYLKEDTLYECYDRNLKGERLNNKTIIDVGCGGGLVREYIGDKKVKYIGLDISRRSIEYAKNNLSKYNNIILKNINPYHINLDYNADALICFSVIQHIPDAEYFEYFMNLLNNSGIKYLYLQIKWNEKLEFKPNVYRKLEDISNACICNETDIFNKLNNYECTKEFGDKEPCKYYHINMRLKNA